MKRKSLLILLLLALLAPWTTSFAQQTLPIGTGTDYVSSGSSAGSSFGSPFGNCYYYNSVAQFIYTAEELNGAKTITSVAFNHNGKSFNANVNIYLFHTTASTVATNDPATSGTPVYTGSGIAVGGSSAGWQTFQLDTPFEYNGTDNLLVVVCRSNYNNGWSNAITWQYSATTDNKFMVRSSDTDGCGDITNTNFSYSASTNRPNIQIGYQTTDPYISLAPASETVLTGFTKTLTATYGNVTGTPTITYTSSNESVATVSGNGTTATVTGEAPGTATITATMNIGGTDYTATAAITVEDPSYCEPSFSLSASYGMYITNFTTSVGINNSTGFSTGGYGDYYDSHAAEIEPGETLDFTVSHGSQYDCGFAIWVDWNQDYEFSANERVATTTATTTDNWSGSFTVGTTTAVGDYRMRVLMQYSTSSPSNPCVSASYGEGEDYKLTVLPPASCPKPKTLTASDVGSHGVTLTWTMDTPLDPTADGFNLEYKKAADPDEPLNWTRVGTAYDLLTTTISGLTPETEYTARVQAACGNNEYSDWRNIAENFTTAIACPAPTALAVTEGSVTASEATVTWEGTSQSYLVELGELDPTQDPTVVDETEGFENSSSLPSGWAILGSGGTAYISSSSGYYYSGSKGLYIYNSSSSASYVIMLPEYELETNQLTVSFWSKAEGSSSGSFAIGYVTDPTDASSFVPLDTYTYSQHTSWQHVEDISMDGAPAGARIAFRHSPTSSYWYWHLDEVTINGTMYPIAWNAPAYTTTNQSYTFENLTPNTKYFVRVKGDCGTEDGESAYTDVIDFTTHVSCFAPTNVQITEGPTAHEITFTWDAEAGELFQYVMLDGTVTDFSSVEWVAALETNTVSWDDLIADSDYTFAIRKYCSTTDQSEVVSLPFHTEIACPAPVLAAATDITGHTATLNWTGTSDSYNVYWRTPAYVDGVDADFSSVPSGWLFRTGALNTDGTATLSGTSSWSRSSTMNNVLDGYHYYANLYGSNVNYWMITPKMTVKEGYDFSFDAAYTPYSNNNALATDCNTHRFVVLISTDNMATWTILREWNNSGTGTDVLDNLSQTGETINVSLASYVGQEVNIAFFAHAETQSFDNNIHIDNVAIGKEVLAGEWMSDITTATTIELSGLDPETLYEAYVVGDCGAEGESLPSNTITFTTAVACLPVGTLAEATEVKSTTAKLSWTLTDNTQTSWDVAVKAEGDADFTIRENEADTNQGFLLEGLEPETTYTVKVRANCGAEDGTSAWSNTITFTTASACMKPTEINADNITSVSADLTWTGESDSYNIQYWEKAEPIELLNEGFESGSMPDGWEVTNTWKVGAGTGYSSSSITTAASGSYNVNYYNSTASNEAWLITPSMNLEGASQATLSFMYVNPEWYGGRYNLKVYYRAGEGEWQELESYTTAQGSWTQKSIALTGFAANYQIGFYVKGYDNDYGYGVGIDDVKVALPGVAGEVQSTTSDTESVTLSGLTAGKTYEVKVQGVCGSTEGEWSLVSEFTTLADGNKVFVTEGNWNEGANWRPQGAPALTDNVIIRANTTIPADCVALANEITVEGENTVTIEDGGQLLHSTVAVYATMKKQVQPYEEAEGIDNYILLASPMQPTVFAEAVENLLPLWYTSAPATFNVDFYQFDNSQELEWVNLENIDEFPLANGEGYLYAHNWESPITLAFKDALMYSHEPKAISLDYNSGNANWAGWNLIGNPFPCNATVSNAADPAATFNYYKINAAGEFVTADGTVAPMEGIFALATEAGQEATFTRVVPGESSNGPTDGILNVNLMSNEAATRKGNSRIDMARLRFGHGNKLGKLNLFRSNATVFFPQDGKDYSVMYADAQGEMPLHFKAEKNGTYTLGFTTEDVSFGYLHLIDNLTGNDVDLLATPSYTFDARTTDYASRFRLVFSANGSNSDDNSSFAFIDAAGNIVITGAEAGTVMQIMDVTGRMILSTNVARNVSTNGMAPGVYMLRLINGTNVKTQKIVVK